MASEIFPENFLETEFIFPFFFNLVLKDMKKEPIKPSSRLSPNQQVILP